jgi:hypothetical protein
VKTARNAIGAARVEIEFVDDAQGLLRGMLYGGALALPFWLGVAALLLR